MNQPEQETHMSNLLNLHEEKTDTNDDLVNRDELEATVKSGANWFYWIAGLSVINSLVYLSGSDWSFLAGLGLTQLTEAFVDISIENGAPAALKAVAVSFSFIMVAVFALFGYYAGKRSSAAFVIGTGLYLVDGLLLLLLGALASAGFHAFALFFIIRGFLACRTLNAYDAARPFQQPPPVMKTPA
jgi:hypothetical protein